MADNSEMVQLWNGDAAQSWSRSPERYDAMLVDLGRRVLDAAALQPGERVVDIGCGAGQLCLQAAAVVGPSGSVLGVDVSADLLAVAAGRAAGAAGPTNGTAAFLEADAQDHPFAAGGFDVVLSRFGVMFFADPLAAFANLLAATAPGGRLAFVAWQAAPFNEWVTLPLFAVTPHTGAPDLPPPGAPGPFALGDADHLRALLVEAGWQRVEVADVQTTVSVGGAHTAAEAVAFTTGDTFGRMMLGKASPAQREAALNALLEAYSSHVIDGEVRAKAAAWLVTARRPVSG